MKRFIVYPYKMGSASAKLLAQQLKAIRVYPDGDYRPVANDVIVNWGNGLKPSWAQIHGNWKMINHWKNVCWAIDKSESFTKFEQAGVRIPQLTTKRDMAIDWIESGNIVLGRAELEGTRGSGIIEMKKLSQFVPCRLYSLYEETTKEFRIYTFNGTFLDILEKRRDSDMLAEGKINYHIRTEENGWVFCRNNVTWHDDCIKEAIKATKALGLVFGGVDVIWNEKKKRATVLEINTAPGIFGTTVSLYANAIKQFAETL